MKIYYRISESSNDHHEKTRSWQKKLLNATKKNCLLNVINKFPNADIKLFVDSITEETWKWLQTLNVKMQKINQGSDAKSMRVLLKEVQDENDNEIILFQEDDYLYLDGSEYKMKEALKYSEYVTGYLHPDKFINPSRGGNPFTLDDNISEPTRVIKTSNHFWMLTNSTTNTFMTTAKTIKEDMDIWMWGTSDLINTHDFHIFLKLREKGRKLLQPIPSLSTHCMIGFEAPVAGLTIDSWEEVI